MSKAPGRDTEGNDLVWRGGPGAPGPKAPGEPFVPIFTYITARWLAMQHLPKNTLISLITVCDRHNFAILTTNCAVQEEQPVAARSL